MPELDPIPGYAIKTTTVPDNVKIFINACSDPQVPAPDTLDPAEIALRVSRDENWIVPIMVSPNARHDTDKSGGPCLVYDCVVNPKVLLLGMEENAVKLLTIETCIELIEDASGLVLSRAYKLPKMKAKGKLQRFEIPDAPQAPPPPSKLSTILSEPQLSKPEPATNSLKITEITSVQPSVDEGYFHLYRGPYSGPGPRPSHVLEIAGKPLGLAQSADRWSLKWNSGYRKLPFAVARTDTLYAEDDETTYIFLFK